MNKAAILRGLCLALLAAMAQAQTIGSGARAVVSNDALPVYASMSESGVVRATLKRGEAVTIGMVLFGSDITWCAISRVGETKQLGFASCEFLEPDRGSRPPESGGSPPPAQPPAAPKSTPVTIGPAVPIEIKAPEAAPAPTPLPPKPPKPIAPERPEPAPADFVNTVLDGFALRPWIANYIQTTRLLSFLDKGRLAEIDVPALELVLSRQFQPDAFYPAIGDQLRKNYAPERLPTLVEWLHSPAARKFAELEERAYSPESRQALVDFAGSLSKTPPPEARLLLIHRLYDALRTCDMEVEATIALVHTTAQAIGPALPREKRYGARELDRALGSVKSRYRGIMKNARLVHYLFAYQEASDAELEQYVNFLESDSGKWLISAMDKGFFEATESISRRLREEIPLNVKSRQH
jgi:hypothetical protein